MKVVVLLAAFLCAVALLPVEQALGACSSTAVGCKERCEPNCARAPFEEPSSESPPVEEESALATKQPVKTREDGYHYSLVQKWWDELTQDIVENDRAKRAVGAYVYRALRWNENISGGIRAKNPYARETIQSHVGHGSSYGYQSQYISTTKSLGVATGLYGRNGNRIAKIDVGIALRNGCRVFDVSTGGYGLHGRALDTARRHREVLFTGTIPPSAITILPRNNG